MALKSLIVLGLVAVALGAVVEESPVGRFEPIIPDPTTEVIYINRLPFPIRKIRSPDGGSANVQINHDDKSGTTGTVSGSQNVWSSPDSNTNVNVEGSASKNFDNGHSNVNVGVGIDW